jgi:lipopolysaccharide transport system permease protein
MKMKAKDDDWTYIIKPVSGWFNFNLKELWHYRDLIKLFFHRDFVVYYKQTILGPIWFLIQPLLTTIMFVIIFGKIAKLSTDGIPMILFYMSGYIAWNYFATCMTTNSKTFSDNVNVFGKVYFPRLVMPVNTVLFNLVTYGIQLVLFFGFWIYYYSAGANIHLNNYLFLLPVIILQMAMLGLGMGIIISSLTTKYRDLNFLVSFGVQLWMYAGPVVYPVSLVPQKFLWLIFLNPMTMPIEIFRKAILGQGYFGLNEFIFSIGLTLVIFIVGIILFSRVEKTFMDRI